MDEDWFISTSRYETEQACLAEFKLFLETTSDSNAPDIVASVAAGRTKFDWKKATACLKELADDVKAECSAAGGMENAGACIDDVFTATVAVGEACATHSECIDSYCDASEMETCPGKCVAYPAEAKRGESCDDNECEDGLFCNYDDEEGYVCGDDEEVIVAEGGACDASEGKICDRGLACNGESMCAKRVFGALDAACDQYNLCEPGLICGGGVDGEGKVEGTCRKFGQKDDVCSYSAQCALGFYCDGDQGEEGKCQEQKMLELGEACSGGMGDSTCGAGLQCDWDQATSKATCQNIAGDREVCEVPAE